MMYSVSGKKISHTTFVNVKMIVKINRIFLKLHNFYWTILNNKNFLTFHTMSLKVLNFFSPDNSPERNSNSWMNFGWITNTVKIKFNKFSKQALNNDTNTMRRFLWQNITIIAHLCTMVPLRQRFPTWGVYTPCGVRRKSRGCQTRLQEVTENFEIWCAATFVAEWRYCSALSVQTESSPFSVVIGRISSMAASDARLLVWRLISCGPCISTHPRTKNKSCQISCKLKKN